MELTHVEANGLRFACLEEGDGPLVLLLHGFPDNAETWTAQLSALAGAGYRAVAPYLRGYLPTQIPANGDYDPATLGDDVRALIEALSPDGRAFLVGTDWGGTSTLAALALHPEVVRAAVTVNSAHAGTFGSFVQDPELAHRGFHLWLFQLPFAATALGAQGLPMVDYLWCLWAPRLDDPAHVASVKATLSQPGVIDAALGFYRALTAAALDGTMPLAPIGVPYLSVFGGDDPTARHAAMEEEWFKGPYRREVVDGVGHFPQRECPDRLNALLLEWFAAHG